MSVESTVDGCSDVNDVVLLSPVVDNWVVDSGLEVVTSIVVASLKFDESKVVGSRRSIGVVDCAVDASLSTVDGCSVVNLVELFISSVVDS